MLGVFMGALDVSIVNVALPTLTLEFDTDLATVQWVVISYGLVVTSFMLSVGRLGDMFGKRSIFGLGLALFTLGSLLAGMSTAIGFMICARCVQAAGAVMMQAPMAALVTEIFPAEESGRALGLIGAAVSVGVASGPALGGLLIAAVNWRLIFLINVPLGLVCLVLLIKWVPADTGFDRAESFDLPGAVLLLAGLSLYALALTFLQTDRWPIESVWWLMAGAVTGLSGFVLWQCKSPSPILDLSLFKLPRLSLGLAMALLVFTGLAVNYMLPFYLQYGLAYSPGEMGLLMMLPPATMSLTAPIAGWWADRRGETAVLVLGLMLAASSCWAITTLGPHSGPCEFLVKLLPLGLGIGLFQTPNIRAIMAGAPENRRGIASGLFSLSRTLGTITGVPLMGALFIHGLGGGLGPEGQAMLTESTPRALSEALDNAGIAAMICMLCALVLGLLAVVVRQRYGWTCTVGCNAVDGPKDKQNV
jgi:EmrB/QacA subfamily drug resistance transporter